MAIWQHQIFLVPKEELDSYYPKADRLTIDDIDNIDWWKYRTVEIHEVDRFFSDLLPLSKSWSDQIVIFGNLDSDCFKLLIENQTPAEFTARFDLRKLNKEFIELIVDFANENNMIFLSDINKNDLRILYPNELLLIMELEGIDKYTSFLKFLDQNDDDLESE